MELEKVAAAAFLDELKSILSGPDGEKVAASFHDFVLGNVSVDDIAEMIKSAGFFDRVKGFVGGGMQNGIPMHSLGSQMAQSNPFTGMGSSLASSARQAGGAIAGGASALAGKASGALGAVGNFIRGGNQNGIPMHSLGSQMAESSPFTGMGASLKQNVPSAMSALAGRGGGAAAPAAHLGGPALAAR